MCKFLDLNISLLELIREKAPEKSTRDGETGRKSTRDESWWTVKCPTDSHGQLSLLCEVLFKVRQNEECGCPPG